MAGQSKARKFVKKIGDEVDHKIVILHELMTKMDALGSWKMAEIIRELIILEIEKSRLS